MYVYLLAYSTNEYVLKMIGEEAELLQKVTKMLAPNNELFCIDTKDGKTVWSAPLPGSNPPGGPGGRPAGDRAALTRTAFGLPTRSTSWRTPITAALRCRSRIAHSGRCRSTAARRFTRASALDGKPW